MVINNNKKSSTKNSFVVSELLAHKITGFSVRVKTKKTPFLVLSPTITKSHALRAPIINLKYFKIVLIKPYYNGIQVLFS